MADEGVIHSQHVGTKKCWLKYSSKHYLGPYENLVTRLKVLLEDARKSDCVTVGNKKPDDIRAAQAFERSIGDSVLLDKR